VEYDGARFAGFQYQLNGRSVQGELERALGPVVDEQSRVIGAGRTDAGVHATGQVVSCWVDTRLDDATLMRAVNARLPQDVAVRALRTVDDGFHARRSALERVYEYRITQGSVRPVLDRARAWHVSGSLDVAAMQAAADRFVGTHDFRAFAVGPALNTVRRIGAATVWRKGDSIFVRIAGTAFLQRMVRRMVGTVVRAGRGELTPEDVTALLAEGSRAAAGPTAPAHGLTLARVAYPGDPAGYGSLAELETASR
jgi:tRNA pseudouridine38-40 synthase